MEAKNQFFVFSVIAPCGVSYNTPEASELITSEAKIY